MGYKLYREIRDLLPAECTPAERLVALMIADDAGEETRKSWIKVPELMRRTGLSADGLRRALQRLAARGCEFRVPIGKGKDGRLVFAAKGHSLDYIVPLMPSIGGTGVPPMAAIGDGISSPNDSKGSTGVPPNAPKAVRIDAKGSTPVPPLSSAPLLKDQKMASRRGANSVRAATLTDQDKIAGTREAAELVYGTHAMEDITDEEMLWLADDKLPKDGRRVSSVRAYMEKIFTDTPHIDTLLAGLDPGDDPDDYDLASEQHPFPPCPRCGSKRAELDPDRGICAWCARELIIIGTADPDGWNQPILAAISKSLYTTTGKTVDRQWCARVADQLLTGRNIKAPVKYVIQAIETDTNPSRFLPTPIPPRVA